MNKSVDSFRVLPGIKNPICSFSFSKIFTAKTTYFEHRSTHSLLFKMETFLAIIVLTAQPDEVEMDQEKLKLFNSKINQVF